MKKIFIILFALLIIFGATACEKKTGTSGTGKPGSSTKSKNLEGSLTDIIAKIYDAAEIDAQQKEFLKTGTQNTPINEENAKLHLGKEGLPYKEAVINEPQFGGAYALALVRVKAGADIEQMKKDIKDNVDPYKWVCMGVKKENIIVDNIGDVIILIMDDHNGQALHKAFLALKK